MGSYHKYPEQYHGQLHAKIWMPYPWCQLPISPPRQPGLGGAYPTHIIKLRGLRVFCISMNHAAALATPKRVCSTLASPPTEAMVNVSPGTIIRPPKHAKIIMAGGSRLGCGLVWGALPKHIRCNRTALYDFVADRNSMFAVSDDLLHKIRDSQRS